MDRQNPRTNGKQSYTDKITWEAYTYTLKKREKGKKKIYIYIVAPKVHLLNFGSFIVYSGIPQIQGTSSWLWRYNSPLLRLLGEISLSLLCSHSSWGLALDMDLPLCVGHLRASVLCSDRMGLKEYLIGGSGSLRLVGGRGTESGGSCGSSGRHDVAPAWGAPCILPGNLSLHHGTLAVVGCTCSREGRCG